MEEKNQTEKLEKDKKRITDDSASSTKKRFKKYELTEIGTQAGP